MRIIISKHEDHRYRIRLLRTRTTTGRGSKVQIVTRVTTWQTKQWWNIILVHYTQHTNRGRDDERESVNPTKTGPEFDGRDGT